MVLMIYLRSFLLIVKEQLFSLLFYILCLLLDCCRGFVTLFSNKVKVGVYLKKYNLL